MKKVALSLAGVLAAAAFAPEASALPVFARQTGMACNACHFQHFPILNGFGRAFKASGFTLMGAQGKVEGDDLSLPDRLNMAVLTTAGLEEHTGTTHNTVQVPGNGGELSLFLGGRISENAGFLSEVGLSMPAAAMSSAKLPMLYEVGGGIRTGLVFLTTAGQGPSYGFELLNTGATAIHLATPMPGNGPKGDHFMAASAHQYIGTGGGGAAGASLVVVNPDMFFVNIGKMALDNAALNAAAVPAGPGGVPAAQPAGPLNAIGGINGAGGAPTNVLNAVYFRAAGMFDAGGMNMAVGVQNLGGSDVLNLSAANATIVDFQAMGDVGSMTMLVTASYGKAPVSKSPTKLNMYNPVVGIDPVTGAVTGKDRTSMNLMASLGFTPHISALVAIRRANSGAVDVNGKGLTDNAVQVGATYGLAQNVELSLTHTRQSGTAWADANLPQLTNGLGTFSDRTGQNLTSLKLEALF